MTQTNLSFKRWLTPPTFVDEEQSRLAGLQHTILWGTIAIALIFGLLTLVFQPEPWPRLLITVLMLPVALGSLLILYRGEVKKAGIVYATSAWLILTLNAWLGGGLMSAGYMSYTMLIVIIGILTGLRVALLFAALSVAMGGVLLYAGNHNILPVTSLAATPVSMWLALTTNFVVAAALVYLATDSISNALKRTRANEAALLTNNQELQAAQLTLQERTGELAAAVDLLEIQLTERQQILESLARSQQELRQLNLELEQRVQERTGELVKMNETLTQEIASRRQAELTLQETVALIERAKREWEVTVDAAPQFIGLLDRQGRLKRANRTVERWNLAPVTQVRGQTIHQLFHPDCTDPACRVENFWRQASQKLQQGQAWLAEADDEILGRYLQWQVEPISAVPGERQQPSDTWGVVVVQDISDRKQAEQRLRESEAKFRSYIQHAPLAVFISDGTGRYVEANQVALDMLGYDAPALYDKHIPDIVPEEDHPVLFGAETALRSVGHYEGELRQQRQDGQQIWISLRAVKISDDRFIAFCRDITARKQAEQALRESEARYRLLAENMVDVVWTMNPAGQFTYVSPSVERLRGYTAAEVLAQSPAEALTPASLQTMQATLMATMPHVEQGTQHFKLTSATHELEQPCKDGSTVWTEALVRALFDDHGNFSGFLGVSRDISERKQTELELTRYRHHLEELVSERTAQLEQANQKLQQSEENFRALADNTQDGFAVVSGAEQVVYVNPSCCQLSGYSAEELLNRPIEQITPPSEYEMLSRRYRQRLSGELINHQYESVFVHKSGRLVPVELTAARTTWYDQPAIVISFRDITERKQAEARYRSLFEQAPAMYVITRNEAGRPIIADCNELFLTSLNFRRTEVVGRPLADFYTSRSQRVMMNGGGYHRALSGQVVAEERQLVTREGRVIETLLRAEPEFDAAGQVIGTRAMYVDITARKLVEAELQQRHQELLALQTASAAISSSLDLNWVLETVTREIANLLQVESCYFSHWDPGHNTLHKLAEYAPAGWRGDEAEPEVYDLNVYPLARQVLATRQPVQLTIGHPDSDLAELAYMKSSRIKTLLMLPLVYQAQRMGLVELEDSRVERTFSEHELKLAQILTDQAAVAIQNARLYEQARQEIAERERVQADLQRSEAQFRQVITSISDHIYVTEITATGEHLNRYISPNVETLTGYAAAKLLADWSFWSEQVIFPADWAIAAAQLAQFEQGHSSESEYRLIRADGQVIWVRDSGRVEPRNGTLIVYGVINDITARKTDEEIIMLYSERLEILREIEQGILSAQSVEAIGQVVVNRIRRIIPCSRVSIRVLNETATEIMMTSGYDEVAGLLLSDDPIKLDQFNIPPEWFESLRAGQVLVFGEDLLKQIEVSRVRRVSVMVVPLIYRTDLIGTLNLSATTAGVFTPEHQEVAQQIADQLAIAIRQTQLYEQVQRHAEELEQRVTDRTRELSALYEVTAVASQALELSAMLAQALGQVLTALRSDIGLIWLSSSEATPKLQLAAQQGLAADEVKQVEAHLFGSGLLGQVLEENQPVVLPTLAAVSFPADLQTLVGTSIRVAGQCLGVVIVFGRLEQQFNLEDVALLSTVADQMGVVVENTRLREQARHAAVLAERERLARELHDSVTQSLYSLTLFAEGALEQARNGQLEPVQHNLTRIGDAAQQALKEMRLMVYELRPIDLEQEGLVGALHQRLAAVERRAGITARLIAEDLVELPLVVEQELFGITQEALNNTLKHSGASVVTVYLRRVGAEVELAIQDNGYGFDPGEVQDKGGLGLRGLRERVAKLHGVLTIRSAPGQGTTIEVRVGV